MFKNILISDKAGKYYVSVIIVLVIIILILADYIFILKKEIMSLKSETIKAEIIKPEDFGAGNTGEIMVKDEETGQESSLVSPNMPSVIFSTAGTIVEVAEDRIVVNGEGTNFADGVPRTLTVIFTDSTITFDKTYTFRQIGITGLQRLQTGMKISIGSPENIRGKIEFKAKTIKIL